MLRCGFVANKHVKPQAKVIPPEINKGYMLASQWLRKAAKAEIIIMIHTPVKAKPINRSVILRLFIEGVFEMKCKNI